MRRSMPRSTLAAPLLSSLPLMRSLTLTPGAAIARKIARASQANSRCGRLAMGSAVAKIPKKRGSQMFAHGLLAPIVALAAWSLLMLIWLYATRIPAMQRAGIKPGQISNDPNAPSKLPPWARNVADNYNHLMEQPTIFYATCFALQLMTITDRNTVTLAWAYVG